MEWKIGDHVKYRLKNLRNPDFMFGEAIINNANKEKICVGYRWYPKENVEILEILYRHQQRKKEDWEL